LREDGAELGVGGRDEADESNDQSSTSSKTWPRRTGQRGTTDAARKQDGEEGERKRKLTGRKMVTRHMF
jgi:hypothetical protein